MEKKVTLRKLAAELGVAPATVLRALSGRPHVRPELRSRIIGHASRSGYALPERRTGNVAVITEGLQFCPYLSALLTRLINGEPVTSSVRLPLTCFFRGSVRR